MIQVSNVAAEIIESTFRTFRARFLYGDEEIEGDIRNVTVQKGSCGSSEFIPGAIFSSSITATVDYCSDILEGRELVYQIGVVLEDGQEQWYDIGFFTVGKPSTTIYTTSFTAYGRISARMGKTYTTRLTFPTTVSAVIHEMETDTGVEIDTSGLNTALIIEKKPDGYMYREVLAYIAGLYFGYATEDSSGKILIRKYSTENLINTDGDRTTQLPSFADIDTEITGIRVTVEKENASGESESINFESGTVNVVISNPFMTRAIFNANAEDIIGFKYRSGSVKITLGDFRIEPFDCMQVTDKRGKNYTVPCMSITHIFDGGISTQIDAPGLKNEEGDGNNFRGVLGKTVERLILDLVEAKQIIANKISADDADLKYATIDKVESESAILKEAIIGIGRATDFSAGKIQFDEAIGGSFTAEECEILDLAFDEATGGSLALDDITAAKAVFEAALIHDLTIDQIGAATAEFEAAVIHQLYTDYLNSKYVEIEFANIDIAHIAQFFSKSGIIENVTTESGTITGELVGVTIKGDLIEGNTIVAEKLVIKGTDGLFYKLNTDGEHIESEQTAENSLDGQNIRAKTITASKISVSDLVAFGATIAGLTIEDGAIHTYGKNNVDSATAGLYLDSEGQFNTGDANNYIASWYDTEEMRWKVAIRADQITFGTGQDVTEVITNAAEKVDRMQQRMDAGEFKGEDATVLRIDSSRGTVFKNNAVSTVLSVTIHHGPYQITDKDTLVEVFGSGAYLEWSWQRMDEDRFGVISATDSRIGNDGFTLTLSPSDVDTKVTFQCKIIID